MPKKKRPARAISRSTQAGVYVIAHSHGGTLTRLAMNLWDKGDDFYDPDTAGSDELKHDDKCPHCRQHRNFKVAPALIDRPDGVITFGSPFVHFRKQEKPLIAARLFAKAMMFIGFLGVIVWYISKLYLLMQEKGVTKTDAKGESQTAAQKLAEPSAAIQTDRGALCATSRNN